MALGFIIYSDAFLTLKVRGLHEHKKCGVKAGGTQRDENDRQRY
jgi:hypothetical protein